ncbi:MAG: adenylate kinase [Thermosediminibacterales bacterium]|nr:adenylate kinase [Thermosediminibacterales bacterium]
MRLIFLGPPGAGKGTQAEKISKEFELPHVSTGDIFRKALKEGTELGLKAKNYMDKGLLVPDDVVVAIVEERLKQEDCEKGFILDGFPRTVPQAEALDMSMKELNRSIDHVINISVSKEELIERLTGRRVCSKCGASFHIKYNTPKEEGVCDICGGELIQRDDDRIETVNERLNVYNEQTQPLIEYYKQKKLLRTVDGEKGIDKVFEEISKILRGDSK